MEFTPAHKGRWQYQGKINGKTYVVNHSKISFHQWKGVPSGHTGADEYPHDVVTSREHIAKHNTNLTPEEIDMVHKHIKDIHKPSLTEETDGFDKPHHNVTAQHQGDKVKIIGMHYPEGFMKKAVRHYEVEAPRDEYNRVANRLKRMHGNTTRGAEALYQHFHPAIVKESLNEEEKKAGVWEVRKNGKPLGVKETNYSFADKYWKDRSIKTGHKFTLHPLEEGTEKEKAMEYFAKKYASDPSAKKAKMKTDAKEFAKHAVRDSLYQRKTLKEFMDLTEGLPAGRTRIDKFQHHSQMYKKNAFHPEQSAEHKSNAEFHSQQADKIWHKMTDAEKAQAFQLHEKTLTSAETAKKEEIVKSMKKDKAGFRARYGARAKEVMYATATKHAKRLAEGPEQLDEISLGLAHKVRDARIERGDAAQRQAVHGPYHNQAQKKMTKEYEKADKTGQHIARKKFNYSQFAEYRRKNPHKFIAGLEEGTIEEAKKLFPSLDDSPASHHQRLVHAVTQYDTKEHEASKKNPRRYHNPHALGHYLVAADQAHEDMKKGHSAADAINGSFNGRLANHLHKALGTGDTDVDTKRHEYFKTGKGPVPHVPIVHESIELEEGIEYKSGHLLHPDDQKHVLSAYVHRYTKEHVPQWSKKPMPNGQSYKPHHETDADWLKNTKFAVKKDGRLHRGVHTAQSTPSLPLTEEVDTLLVEHGYVGFDHKGTRHEVEAPTLYDAIKQIRAKANPPKSKAHLVHAALAELDTPEGRKQYVHTAMEEGVKVMYKTGDGKKHATLDAAKSHAESVHKKTGNIISVEPLKEAYKVHVIGRTEGKKDSRKTYQFAGGNKEKALDYAFKQAKKDIPHTDHEARTVEVNEAKSIKGDVFKHHQTQVAKKTLRMHDAVLGVLGGMTKDDARQHLKMQGWSDKQVHAYEHGDHVKESLDTSTVIRGILSEVYTRRHFRQVADIIKNHPDAKKRKTLAQHHAEIFAKSNPRFDHKRFFSAAGATMNEETEQLDELKKSTLASYVHKASPELRHHSGMAIHDLGLSQAEKTKQGKQKYRTLALRHMRKGEGREIGIQRAALRLAKEGTEQLDELKKSTLASYVKKAVPELRKHEFDVGSNSMGAGLSRIQGRDKEAGTYTFIKNLVKKDSDKRAKGIVRATEKLAKEEVEQVEENYLEDRRFKGGYEIPHSTHTEYHAWGHVTHHSDDEAKADRDKKAKEWKAQGFKVTKHRNSGQIYDPDGPHTSVGTVYTARKHHLEESVEQLDELKASTLGSYTKKAAVDAANRAASLGTNYNTGYAQDVKKASQRLKGVSRATQKLLYKIPHPKAYVDLEGKVRERVSEGRLAMPLKGHDYHYKTDAELHYIAKDAAEARDAVGTHDPKASGKYADQVNDAATVMHYRRQGGKQLVKKTTTHTPDNIS